MKLYISDDLPPLESSQMLSSEIFPRDDELKMKIIVIL